MDDNSPTRVVSPVSRRFAKLARVALAALFLAAPFQGCGRSSTPAKRSQQSQQPERVVDRPEDTIEAGKILLGEPSLTAGITGKGPLSVEEVERWLADPINHEPIEVTLPFGLREKNTSPVIPPDNPLTRAKIELGRQLFFDVRLAKTGFSCGRCHDPWDYYANKRFNLDPTVKHVRTVPVVYNRILSDRQLWDGRAASLEEQAVMPIVHPHEMVNTPEGCIQTLSELKGYYVQFDRIFGEVTMDTVGKALAAFERCIVTLPSPYDYQAELSRIEARNDNNISEEEQAELAMLEQQVAKHPMSPAAKRGEALFFSSRIGCAECHSGVNFTDEAFHNLGVGMDEEDPDLGRFLVTKDPADRGAFKTPTLRNVEHTAPYMHRGQIESLEEVVAWYAAGGFENDGLSLRIKPVELTDEESQDLVAFLKSLSSPITPVETGRLPDES